MQLCDHSSLPASNSAEKPDIHFSPNPDSAEPIQKSQQFIGGKDPRKRNLIFFGIPESPQGSKFNDRLVSDLKVISSTSQSLKNPIPSFSLIECHQLGKYNLNHSTPCLIQVKFNSPIHVSIAMGNTLSIKTTNKITIKRDLPVEQRQMNNLLLKEIRQLINSGKDQKLIKIRNNHLIVDSKIHGSVTNGSVTLHIPNTSTTLDQL